MWCYFLDAGDIVQNEYVFYLKNINVLIAKDLNAHFDIFKFNLVNSKLK